VVKLPKLPFIACALVIILAGLAAPAHAQELSIPCYAFLQDPLGNWIATEPVTMDLPDGTIDIAPRHRISIPVAEILDARCW
jgi:hypothetical protein